jgi:hypothetical protein
MPRCRDAENAGKEATYDGPDYPDDDVAEQAETAALHEESGQPAGNGADCKKYDQACYVHDLYSYCVDG